MFNHGKCTAECKVPYQQKRGPELGTTWALKDRDNTDITQLTQHFTDYVTDQWVEGDRSLWNRGTTHYQQH
jgi:hypothetical protein